MNKRIVLRAKDASLEIYNKELRGEEIPKALRNIAELSDSLSKKPAETAKQGSVINPDNWWMTKSPRSRFYYARNIFGSSSGCMHRYLFEVAYTWTEYWSKSEDITSLKSWWTLAGVNLYKQRSRVCCYSENKDIRSQIVELLNPRNWDSAQTGRRIK